jgi:hypothetical protein
MPVDVNFTGSSYSTLEDHPDFPRFNMASTALRDAEGRLLQALKSGNKAEIVAAKLALTGPSMSIAR